MTTPGGVPNLPVGALTLDNLATRLQDMTPPAIRNLASQGLPSVFNLSNGGNVLSDLTPFGIITRIFAEFASAVANADPADIQGPDDLPGLLLDFIEGLPIIGELVGLLEAIMGTYDGDDAVLIAVQEIFFPIRKLLQLVSGQPVGFPTIEEVTVGWTDLNDALIARATEFANLLAAAGQVTATELGALLQALIEFLTAIPANLLTGALNTAVTVSGNPIGTLLSNINSSGQFAAAQVTGALNTAITVGGTTLGTLIPGGQLAASQLTGALNGAVTFGGTALSTLLQNLTGTGQFAASQLTGALNTAVTVGGTALSTLIPGGQLAASQLTGALNSAVTLGGTTLSTLVTNINSSGQLLASGITGALPTAVTVSGNTIGGLLQNLNASGQLVGSAITGAINTAATINSQAIGTVQANAQGLVDGINNAAAGLLSGGSALLADAQANLNLLLTAPAQFLQGLSGQFGITPTQNAYAAASAAQSAQAAQLTAQQSAFNAVFNVSPVSAGNVSATVDFSTMADAANLSGVMSPGTGPLGITSGAVQWQGSGTGTYLEVFPTQTATDYQVITATLGSLNNVSGGWNSTTVVGRSNSARNTYVAVDVFYASSQPVIQLSAWVSGTQTVFVQLYPGPMVAVGGTIKLILGDPGSSSPYAMQVLYNGTPIITYTDSAHVSQIGASYHYVGLRQVILSGYGGQIPPAIRSVTYQDNPPASASYPFSGTPTAGTKGRLYISDDVGLIQRDNGNAWERVWGGPLGWLTAPPAFSSSLISGGTFSADKDGRSLALTTGAFAWNVEYSAISPASNYICRAYFECLPFSAEDAFQGPSIILYDSVSGKLVSWGYGYDPSAFRLQALKWTSVTAFSAAYLSTDVSTLLAYGINWWQIRDDGSNRYFEYSFNGVDFYTAASSLRTDFITPTHIGWGAGRTPAKTFQHRLRSWKQSA